MLINKECELILHNLFDYDIQSCYYTILKNIDSDLINDIDPTDKKSRNIKIGLLQKEKPKLAQFLLQKTTNIIDLYLEENDINPKDIIWRQKDGIILTKNLKNTNITTEIQFKGLILTMISSIKRDRVLFVYDNQKVVPKGIKNKTVSIEFFDMFSGLNYTTPNTIMNGIEVIRQKIFESNNPFWFIRELDNQYLIPIKNKGIITAPKSFLLSLDPNSIDKTIVWDNYVWPFCQTLLLTHGKISDGNSRFKNIKYNPNNLHKTNR